MRFSGAAATQTLVRLPFGFPRCAVEEPFGSGGRPCSGSSPSPAWTVICGPSPIARGRSRTERAAAKADLDAAKSRTGALDRSALDADVSVVLRGPEAGIVRAVNAPVSSLVPAGAPLVEITGTGSLW